MDSVAAGQRSGRRSLRYFDDSHRNVEAARALGVDARLATESIHDVHAALGAIETQGTGR